jgi:plastocyanin
MKRLTPLLVVIALLLTATPAQAATQTVTMSNNFFSPSPKTVNRGDKVMWTNTAGFDAHTSTGLTPLGLWSSGSVAPNKTFTTPVALIAAGTYPYKCTIHFGMNGTIKVPLSAVKAGRKITLTLASAPSGATHKFVVQKKSGSSAFATLGAVTTTTYVFNAPSAGTYQFRSALQKNGTTATAAFFSTPISVTVT